MRRYLTLLSILVFASEAKLAAQVHSAFTPSAIYGCPPLVVNYTDNSTGNPSSYYWDFDNGNTSTLQNPSTSYPLPGVYNVLHVVSNGTSRDTSIQQIRVFQPPVDSFTSIDNRGCNNPCHMVDFTNLTIPGESPVVQYVWDFGDMSNAVYGYDVSHCYSSAGSFQVTLVSRDSNGCQTSKIMPNYVVISPAPTASLTATPNQACNPPLNVSFTGTGASVNGAVTYEWFFGNGSTSAQQNPSTTYNNQGIYHPILVVSDSTGCADTAQGTVAITPISAGFTASTLTACSGIAMQFTDTSNYATSWSWNFGDGTTSTVQNPFHTYASAGTYTVSLTVTYNSCSGTHTENSYISVTQPINFTFSGSNLGSCFPPLVVNFSNTSSGGSSYLWNFGDGTTSNQSSPTHVYNTAGAYTVSLSISNSSGCVNTDSVSNYIVIGGVHASFTMDSINGCTPMLVHFTNTSTSSAAITSYAWTFGDGGTSTAQNPSHDYTVGGQYIPTLIVTNANGCSDTFVSPDTVKVGQALVPNFTANPLVQCVDQVITFADSTHGVDPNTRFQWQFGDGSTSNLENPTHTYSDTGYFNVTLTVINQGCPADTVRLRYIFIVVPKSIFVYSSTCANPTRVSFRDTSEGANTWLWEFGDGTTSTLKDPVHNYAVQGNYTVTLIVSNARTGCVDSSKQFLLVGTPVVKFTATPLSGCIPLRVQFKDSSTFASSQFWIFSSGATSASKNPAITFADTGQYTVTLIVNPGSGCADTLIKVNYITAYGIKPLISASPHIGCAPLTVNFNDYSSSYMGNITAWKWTFGTGDTSALQNPVYTYNGVGTDYVSVKITDSHGCIAIADTVVQPSKITAAFTSDTAICPGEAIHCANVSTNADSYLWSFGDGTTSTQTNPSHVYTSSAFYTITLVAYNTAWGCSDTVTKANYVNVDTPMVNFIPSSTFAPCPPFPVEFTNISTRPGLSWIWNFGDGDTSTSKNPIHFYYFPGDYNVTLTATDSFGCKGSLTKIDLIRVRGPVGHFSVTPKVGCAPVTATFSGTIQSNVVSSIAFFGDGTSVVDTINLVHTYATAGIYYPVYQLKDSLGCVVAYPVDTITVGLIPYPNLSDTTVCKGNYVAFNLELGDHFIWTSNLPKSYLSCDTCRNPVCMSPDTIKYYVTATTNLGCTASDTVVVNEDALPQVFPGLHYTLCPHDTLTLNAGPGVKSATWTPDLFISDTNSVNPKIWPPDTVTYRVTGSNDLGCSISRIVKIWPISKVSATLSVHDTTVCEFAPVTLDVNVVSASFKGATFEWVPAKYLSNDTGSHPTAIAPPGNYKYLVIVKSSTCIADSQDLHLIVATSPDLEAGDNQTVAEGTNVQLYAASHQNVNYLWQPTVDSLTCTDCRRPFINVTQTQTVFVTAENATGCKTTDSVVLKVVSCDSKMVFVPNTFTPNGDGVNDKLFVRGSGLRQLEYFRVFDRWGKLVFETHTMDEGWDGNINGKPADVATYVFTLKGICSSGSTVDKSGNVTLVR